MRNSIDHIRNIAIIAHVDHGKTTLVDTLLNQSGTLDKRKEYGTRIMDSNDLERERGITILAKNTAINYKDYRINIVDTPGHADFGGEVERILSMVDAVLLVVDAVDGPMPQTRFVTQKAFKHGLKPIVVINKIDRDGARPDWVVDQVFDLFDNLGATDEQLDFPIIYTSALQGFATLDHRDRPDNMNVLFEEILKHAPVPQGDVNGPLQMRITTLDYSSYVGAIGVGRIQRGTLTRNMPVTIVDREGKTRNGKVLQVLGYLGLDRSEIESAQAGDIVAISGIENLQISDTICDPKTVEALPALTVDEPTISMVFQVNDSPFAGKEGKYLTTRQIQERLDRELIHNVALRVQPQAEPNKFLVSGRGELHLSILLETMRREGYELAVSSPQVILKEIDGVLSEPYENLVIDIEEQNQGAVMEELGSRKAQMENMLPDGKGRVRLDYKIATSRLLGFRSEFMTMTSGTGLMFSIFAEFQPAANEQVRKRRNGVLVSMCDGKATAFSLWNLQDRGRMIIGPQTEVYEGMVVGIHSRNNDLVVNVIKGKKLTNMRASGSDEAIILTPHINMSLEQALDFIEADELVEITPKSLRVRKKKLKEHERKRD